MSRWMVGVPGLCLALCGCDGQLSSRSDVAAEAGSNELTAERVAEILGKSGGGPTMQAAEFVSNIWLDYALFAEAVATRRLGSDSATIARVMWPEIAQARITMWRDTLLRSFPDTAAVTAATVDSVYRAGEVRLFQHVITIPAGPAPADSAAALSQIRAALARVTGGTDFGTVAAEVSADGSKNDQGYLGVFPRGQFVPEFESAAWALEPGQVSQVVKSQFGWHIIRRPPPDEARVRFDSHLKGTLAERNDSAFAAALLERHKMEIPGGAPSAIRSAATDPEGSRRSSRTLVTLAGDDVKVSDFVKWLGMFPLQQRLQLRNGNDTVLTQFAKALGQMTVVLRSADSADFQLAPAQWQFVTLKYTNSVDAMRRDLGLEVPELSDSSTLATDQRSKLAAEKVEDYFARLLDGQAQMQMLLPPLAAELRAEKVGRVNQAGISRAVELAMAQFRRDSAAAAARGPRPEPGLQPAPAGPPISDSSGQ